MAGIERLSPEPESPTTKSIDVARNAGENARKMANRNRDLISPVQARLLEQNEKRAALLEFGEKRFGYINDSYSLKPGLTMYLTPEGYEKVVEVCQEAGYPIPEDQIIEIVPELIAINLPKGVYIMDFGGASFFTEASEAWIDTRTGEKPFSLGYRYVVRVEGDDGEIWQNLYYKWDGSPKK